MDGPSLKKSHPQKYYFKVLCRLMFYLGIGDFWYEKSQVSYYRRKLYTAWMVVSIGYMILVLIDELLSYLRTDLTEQEKTDLIVLSLAHSTIFCKLLTLFIWRDSITFVLERLLEGTRSIFHSTEIERESVKQFAKQCFSLTAASYMTLGVSTIEGIRTHLKEDIPIRTEVVYFPNPSQTGFIINVLRFFVQFHWYYIVAVMVTSDCLALCSLITVSYKFKLLGIYFRNLRAKVIENKEKKTKKELEEEFKKDFVIGIKLHADALWCARNVQKSMGPLYSIQVMETVALLVMCLINVVMADRNYVHLLAYLAFIVCLIILTGCYMTAAGDITHEASLVSTAIFHSGWEQVARRTDLRVLAVVALQMSQVPVYMTAFGVITLSHTNLITVLRSSYSFFAVMY